MKKFEESKVLPGLWKGNLSYPNLAEWVLPEYIVLEILTQEEGGKAEAIFYAEEQPFGLRNKERRPTEKITMDGYWIRDTALCREKKVRLNISGRDRMQKEIVLELREGEFAHLTGTLYYGKRPSLKGEVTLKKDRCSEA